MKLSSSNLTLLLISALSLVIVLASACEDREPQDLFFSMIIERGELAGDESTVTVYQGDTVTIDWTSDLPLLVHLHGYNIETQLEPGVPAQMSFVADATGQYDIYIHALESVLTDGGEQDMDGMTSDSMGSGSMDNGEAGEHANHMMTDEATNGGGGVERQIATLEVRP